MKNQSCRIIFLCAWLVWSAMTLRAEVIYKETFGTPLDLTFLENYTGWTAPGCVYQGTARIAATLANRCSLPGSSGGGYVYFSTENIKDVTVSGLKTEGYDNLVLSFNCKLAYTASTFRVQVSTDGILFTEMDFYKKKTTAWQKVVCATSLPASGQLWIRFEKTSNDDGKAIYFDDVIVSGVKQTGERVEEPVFTLAEGIYDAPQTVGIDCPTLNAEIYYTIDGSEPALNSQYYDEAIPVARTMKIKAFAVKEGMQSETASAIYTVKSTNVSGMTGLVAGKNGEYYALSQLPSPKITNAFAACEAYPIAEKMVIPSMDLEKFRWNVNTTAGTITTPSGSYLTATTTSTALTLATKKCSWTWNETYNCWTMGNRAIAYSQSGSYFRNYSISEMPVGGGASTNYTNPAVETEICPGYVRQVAADTYGTLCLPYGVDVGQFLGVEFYSIAGKLMSDGKATALVLKGPVDGLQAGTPYLFKALSERLVVVCNPEVYSETVQSANGLYGSFEGVNVAKDPTDEALVGAFVVSGKKLVSCAAGSSLAAARAYVVLEDVSEYRGETPAKTKLINLSPTTDFIETNPIEPACSDVYTLTGICVLRKVTLEKAQRILPAGIYVMKNKKVVIK